jgi:hypothetical protein
MILRMALAATCLLCFVAAPQASIKQINPKSFMGRELTPHEGLLLAYSQADTASVNQMAAYILSEDSSSVQAADARLFLALCEKDPAMLRQRLAEIRRDFPSTVWEREAFIIEARLDIMWDKPVAALAGYEAARRLDVKPPEGSWVEIDYLEVDETLVRLHLMTEEPQKGLTLLEENRNRAMSLGRRTRLMYLEAACYAQLGQRARAEMMLRRLLLGYPGTAVARDAKILLDSLDIITPPPDDIPDTLEP